MPQRTQMLEEPPERDVERYAFCTRHGVSEVDGASAEGIKSPGVKLAVTSELHRFALAHIDPRSSSVQRDDSTGEPNATVPRSPC